MRKPKKKRGRRVRMWARKDAEFDLLHIVAGKDDIFGVDVCGEVMRRLFPHLKIRAREGDVEISVDIRRVKRGVLH